jgi:hypothetical protein
MEGLAWGRQELEAIVSHLHGHIILRTLGRGHVMANLRLVRAAHEFAAAVGASSTLGSDEKRVHLEFATKSLLPFCKRVILEFVSEKGMDGIWMDDSGLLAGLVRKGRKNAALAAHLRLNALWYVALEMTGMALRGLTPMGAGLTAKDSSGDHFERLAGRFRRAFNKVFWCEEHQRVCPQELRGENTHGEMPDAEQLLLMVLPVCPIPRTKQLGILVQLENMAQSPVGLWVRHEGGMVESPVHRAWLAQAMGDAAENETERMHAASIARPLAVFQEAVRTAGVHAYYRDGAALGEAPDPIVTSEVRGALHRFVDISAGPEVIIPHLDSTSRPATAPGEST